jgi:hypothetical protein
VSDTLRASVLAPRTVRPLPGTAPAVGLGAVLRQVPCGVTDQREFGCVTLNYQNQRPVDCSCGEYCHRFRSGTEPTKCRFNATVMRSRSNRRVPRQTLGKERKPAPGRVFFCLDWSGRDAGLRNDRDDPTRRGAGPIFPHRADKPRDRRALYRQGRLFVPILGVAAASRQFWISRLERLHGITDGRGTQYSSATIRRISVNH